MTTTTKYAPRATKLALAQRLQDAGDTRTLDVLMALPYARLHEAAQAVDPRDVHDIPLDARGYVRDVQCNRYHSGNRRLAPAPGGTYECSGCQTFYSAGEVRGASGPYTGGGGLCRRAPAGG